jgi:predicted ABC-type ATPase
MNSPVKKDKPMLIILAGPNGAGKSTFYKLAMSTDIFLQKFPFINQDEIAKGLAGDQQKPEDVLISAGKVTLNKLDKLLHKKRTFIYETTGSGHVHLKLMDRAHENGFMVASLFFGLSDVQLSHLRVQKRVADGGHSVEPEDIERRYPRIIQSLPEMLVRSDIAAVFDNSWQTPYQLVFFMDKEKILTNGEYPEWVKGALDGRKTSKEIRPLSPQSIQELKKYQLDFAHHLALEESAREAREEATGLLAQNDNISPSDSQPQEIVHFTPVAKNNLPAPREFFNLVKNHNYRR